MAKKATKKGLRTRVQQALHRHSYFGKVEEIADRRRHAFNQRAREARIAVEQLRAVKELQLAQEGLSAGALEDTLQQLALAELRLKRMRRKRDFWRRRYVWARERHRHWRLVLKHRRDRLRRWIRRHEGFQPYMANGNPHEKLTAEAKRGIYLDFRDGNYVTSTYEGAPGDGVHSSSSGHYVQNQPDGKARCWDSGAGRLAPMVKAQRREAERAGPFMIELIGPDNAVAYKNGVPYTLAEGSWLEEMHDNHVHKWIRDGAPT